MKKFKITFEVLQPQLETITGLLSNEVSSMHIEEVMPAAKNGHHTKSMDWTWAPAKRILETMVPGKEYHYEDARLGEVMKELQLSPTSIGQVISALFHAGKIKKVKRGVYLKP